MNKGILVEQDVLNNIIELANKRAESERQSSQNSVNFFDKNAVAKALSPTKESAALQKAVENLNPDQAREISSIMYLGRDYSGNIKVEKAIAHYREDANNRDLEGVKISIFEKTPLDRYLLDGLKKLND